MLAPVDDREFDGGWPRRSAHRRIWRNRAMRAAAWALAAVAIVLHAYEFGRALLR